MDLPTGRYGYNTYSNLLIPRQMPVIFTSIEPHISFGYSHAGESPAAASYSVNCRFE